MLRGGGLSRRSLFGILAGAVAAPIVVRSGLLMPVKALPIIVPARPLLSLGGLIAVNSPYLDQPEHFRVVSITMSQFGTLEVEGIHELPNGARNIPHVRPSSLSIDAPVDHLIDVTHIGSPAREFIVGMQEPMRARFEIAPGAVDLSIAPARAA